MFTVRRIPTKQPGLPHPIRRVAAYCRVSTRQEEQQHSLEVQKAYYYELISKNPLWAFASIYADRATGRNNARMHEFQRMMADCREGRIDLILVKSVSRLGRNTVQLLEVCDELKQLNVDVFFEVERIHISDPRATLYLSVFAALYQNESESKSFAIRWGILTRFRNGSSGFANRKCYGYSRGSDGVLAPIPEEAEIVRKIYRWRDEGCSLRTIVANLFVEGIPAPRGGAIWGIETIRKILKNEKYTGDVILQKTFVADYYTGRQRENRGEFEKYLISDHHEGIIKE